MKKLLFIALVMLFGFNYMAKAQDESTREENLPNVLKVNPFGLAFGNINLNYQRALGATSAIQIGANYWYKILGTEVNGFGVRGSYQFFITNRAKAAPEGFYIGPSVSYNSFTEKSTDASASAVGVGFMLGYQWIWDSGMTLDLGIGPIYQFANDDVTEESYDGVLPNITVAIGFNF